MKNTKQRPIETSPVRRGMNVFPRGRFLAAVECAARRFVSGGRRAGPVPPPVVRHEAATPCHDTPCCIFSHHDPTSLVDPTVYRFLASLKEAGYAIFFVSTVPDLTAEDIHRLAALCSRILHRDNTGLDFASWRSALDLYPSIREAPELLLANDSVYLRPAGLARVFSAMATVDCDFWGLTESREKCPHLQSYFLVFRRRALVHPAFRNFWDSVGILPEKKAVIDCYETGLTQTLALAGLKPAAYVPAFCPRNPTLAYPTELMSRSGLPLIKRACLKENPLRVPLHDWESRFAPEETKEIRGHMARLGRPLPRTALPEMSILLPTYNGSAYLEPLLDSLPATPGTRLLARDDGSEDATFAILQRYQQQREHKVKIHSGERLGAASNAGWLLARCQTPYFLLADQDDIWEPEKLPALWEAMQRLEQRHGKDVPLLVYSDASLIDGSGALLAPSFFKATGTPPSWGETFRNALVFSPAPGCTMMGNRALARSAPPVPDEAFMHDWWLLLVAGALGGVRVVDAPLVRYRQHTRNVLGASLWNARTLFRKALAGPERSRALIRKTQLQARLLLERHGSAMPARHRGECRAWADMAEKPWPQRVLGLLEHSFAKPGKLRNLLFYLTN